MSSSRMSSADNSMDRSALSSQVIEISSVSENNDTQARWLKQQLPVSPLPETPIRHPDDEILEYRHVHNCPPDQLLVKFVHEHPDGKDFIVPMHPFLTGTTLSSLLDLGCQSTDNNLYELTVPECYGNVNHQLTRDFISNDQSRLTVLHGSLRITLNPVRNGFYILNDGIATEQDKNTVILPIKTATVHGDLVLTRDVVLKETVTSLRYGEVPTRLFKFLDFLGYYLPEITFLRPEKEYGSAYVPEFHDVLDFEDESPSDSYYSRAKSSSVYDFEDQLTPVSDYEEEELEPARDYEDLDRYDDDYRREMDEAYEEFMNSF